jgi:hypothetical protein
MGSPANEIRTGNGVTLHRGGLRLTVQRGNHTVLQGHAEGTGSPVAESTQLGISPVAKGRTLSYE